MPPEEFRISVGNLAPRVIVKETGEIHYLAILNPTKYNTGKVKLFQPIGGGAELTEAGRIRLRAQFGAHSFSARDARFLIPGNLKGVMEFFEERFSAFVELGADREICEEFCDKELDGIDPILTLAEAESIEARYVKAVRQPPAKSKETSPMAIPRVPSRRLFYLHDLWTPQAVFDKIVASPAIRELSSNEMATTEGGSCKGETEDGIDLADNISEWI